MMITPIVRPICTAAQRLSLRLFADLEVSGGENLPATGPLIIVANHQSNIDPPLLAAVLKRNTWFLAKAGIFKGPIIRWFLTSWGAFPLKRGEGDVRALRWILRKLESGEAVVLFPEGTRNPGAMRRARPGVVQVALRTRAPLVPVGITGTEHLNNVGRVFNPAVKLRVRIGEPFTLPALEGKPKDEELDSLTEMVMGRIAELLPESHRGVYARTTSGEAPLELDPSKVRNTEAASS